MDKLQENENCLCVIKVKLKLRGLWSGLEPGSHSGASLKAHIPLSEVSVSVVELKFLHLNLSGP